MLSPSMADHNSRDGRGTSAKPINANAIRTEIIITNSVVGRYRYTIPKWEAFQPTNISDQIRQTASLLLMDRIMSSFKLVDRPEWRL
jgi:hypothetical protein